MSAKRTAPRGIHEMTAAELDAEVERICGLPMPPRDAPNYRELLAEHEVAANFLIFLRTAQGDPDAAKARAAEFTLRNHVLPVDELAPHIERAMGRKLLAEELATKTISLGR